VSIKHPEMLDEFTQSLVKAFAPSKAQEQAPRQRKRPALNSLRSPLGRREGRARAYVVIADRLQFHLEAGTLPAEAAEHVQHAHDALMKASAVLRRAENATRSEHTESEEAVSPLPPIARHGAASLFQQDRQLSHPTDVETATLAKKRVPRPASNKSSITSSALAAHALFGHRR
jgi:hypothetical protein